MSLAQALLIPGMGGAVFAAVVTSIAPATANNGDAKDITITGTGFKSGDVASFGNDVTVNSTTFVADTTLTANITVSAALAATGTRTCTVTRGSKTATLADCLTITKLYQFRDLFTTADAAPLTTPRTCEPGPGTLTAVELDGTLAISGGKLAFTAPTSPAYTDLGVYGGAITREVGTCFGVSVTPAATTTYGPLAGFGAAAASNAFQAGVFFAVSSQISMIVASGDSGVIGLYAAATTYELLISLRATGCFVVLSGGAYGTGTLMYVSNTNNTATVYPKVNDYDANFSVDNLRVSVAGTWTPTPLVSDAFTRGDSDTVGNSAGGGSAESGGTGIACTEVAGDWDISSNALVTAGADPGTTDWIVTWASATVNVLAQVQVTLQANSSAGFVLASDGTDWYIMTIDDAANTIRIYEYNGVDTYTQLASTDIAIAAATAYQLLAVRDGATITGYVNGASRVTITDASPINAASTAHGLYSATAGDAFDNLVIWNRAQTLPSF